MKRFLAIAMVCGMVSPSLGAAITTKLVLQKSAATTNALVYPGEFDVYSVVATNPNDAPATSLELNVDFPGKLDLADRTFKAGPENPLVFGFEAPDTFFVLPAGTDPADVLAVNTIDTPTGIGSSFTVAGGAELIPALGEAPILTVSVPTGTVLELPEVLGRAAVRGQFEEVLGIPEPSAFVLAALGAFGFARRR